MITRTNIINNLIKKHNYQNYLEIGISLAANFNKINCKNKTGVDPDPESSNHLKECNIKTSDVFFKDNEEPFDIIFIDGLHEAEQVYNDIINSLNCLAEGGTIVCHDMLPPNELCQIVPRQQTEWTGDCWKAWVRLRYERSDLSMQVLNTDYGCGIIQRGHQERISYKTLTWEEFQQNKQEWLNIIEN